VNQLTPATALVGDRLAIRFFEREAIKPVTMTAGTSPLHFERLDLSGTYEVDAQGEVSLPLVGRVKAEGRSIACLEAAIGARYAETFSTPASVSAAFASRAPVLVAGAVRAEGTYNYTQGMILRHVLALAGASPSQSTRAVDIALMARKEELDDLMAGNRLKMLALASARAGSATMAMNEAQRANFSATVGTERLEIEAANLRARVEAQNRKQKELAARIEDGRARIGLLIEEMARLERHVTDKQARLKALRDLNARGITPASRLSADEAILTALERAFFEIKIELLQAESSLEADVRALDAIADENEQAIAVEMREGAEEADSIKAQLASIQFQLNPHPQGMNETSSATVHRYTIVRTTTQGTTRSEAGLESAILPGDIVEVETVDHRIAGLD
jgi:polysaccharide export outer membrane protein